jgi:hypothetical protein
METPRRTDAKLLPSISPSLSSQLDRYFNRYFSKCFVQPSSEKKLEEVGERAKRIIGRNNQIAELLQSHEYQEILREEKELIGNSKLGFVFCIDGRIPPIILFGRAANCWEEPAGLIQVETAGEETIPASTHLSEAFRSTVNEGRDVFEVILAHHGLSTNSVCGAMKAMYPPDFDRSLLPVMNLEQIEQDALPAVLNIVNRQREDVGLPPLTQVGVSALLDTDTFGLSLGYGTDHELRTTTLINDFRVEQYEGMISFDFLVQENVGPFGSMRDRFMKPEHFIEYSRKVLGMTKFLLDNDIFITFREKVGAYINQYYSQLSDDQKQALNFVIAKATAVQYVTGLSEIPAGGPTHPFAEHDERYMALSLKGKTLGRHDPEEQVFGCSSSDANKAISHIKTQLNLMDDHPGRNNQGKPRILFLSEPVERDLWEKYVADGNETVGRIIAANTDLYRMIHKDKELATRIIEEELAVVPVLVDQNTGEILTVLNQTVYI